MTTMPNSVLITGAGTGLGLATALHLAQHGFRVYASVPDLSQRETVATAAAEHKVSLSVLQLDVTDQATIDAAVDTLITECGEIYGLVNSAGLGLRGFFEDLSEEEIRRLFDVNVFGTMAVVRAVLPHMRAARRGRVVIITSAGGRIASMTISAYCASKFALEGFGESLALEIAPFGLRVSLVEPGLVMTPHFTVNRGRANAATDPASPYYAWFLQHESIVDGILHQNRVTPADVGKAVYRALTDTRPRLRYVVGWRAKLLICLRRYLPGQLFEQVYARQMQRLVTEPARPAHTLSDLSLPGALDSDCLILNPSGRVEANRDD
jgi:NAD(P)-dependent dehydrogenase (short-subunit alcohol dehydrogenase family)